MSDLQNASCKSVFKSGSEMTKEQYTAKWIEMINQMEKSKMQQ